MSDHHIQFLKEEFLPYCKIWEESVIARDGFSDSQKEMMLIAKESRTGLQISDTYVFNCVRAQPNRCSENIVDIV